MIDTGAAIQRSSRRMIAGLGFAICDQALFSGTSFAFTLLLGRWMTQEDFGAFSITFSMFVLLQNVYEGLVSEPLSVFGAGRWAQQFDAYIGRLLIGHVFVAGALASIVLLITLGLDKLHHNVLARAFLGMGFATPFLLGRILTRQPLYITGRVHWSVMTGAVYLCVSVILLSLLQNYGLVTPFSAFLALGFGSMIASLIVVLVFLDPIWVSPDAAVSSRRLIAAHVAYGGWAVSERLLLWLQTNISFVLLPLISDLHAGAVYRVVTTLAMPAYMALTAVYVALLPALARAHHSLSKPSWIRMIAPCMVTAALIYCLLLVGVGQEAAHIVFGGRYDIDLNMTLLITAGIGPILFASSAVLELRARARLAVRQVFMARISATTVLAVAGVPLIFYGRVLGAVITLDMMWLVTFSALMFFETTTQTR